MYQKSFQAGWADMDFNGHMRNTAFLDRVADVRFHFFADHGYTPAGFIRERFGPVVMKDEIEYYREVHLMGEFIVSLKLAGLAADGSRFRLQNDFYRADATPVAKVASTGGWLNLETRKLIAPPSTLLRLINEHLIKTDDFVTLPSSLKAEAVAP